MGGGYAQNHNVEFETVSDNSKTNNKGGLGTIGKRTDRGSEIDAISSKNSLI